MADIKIITFDKLQSYDEKIKDYVDEKYIAEPAADGSAGQFLQTDGSGNRVWASAAQPIKASATSDGLMSKEDFAKLASITVDPADPLATESYVDDKIAESKTNVYSPTGTTAVTGSAVKSAINSETVDTYSNASHAPISGIGVSAAISAETVDTYSETSSSPISGKGVSAAISSSTVSTYSPTGTNPVNGKAINDAIAALDKSDAAVANKYVSAVSETDGIISVSRDDFPAASATQAGFMSSADFNKLSAIASGKTIATTDDVSTAVDTAVGALDLATVGGGADEFITSITQVDGKVTATKSTITLADGAKDGLLSAEDFTKLSYVPTSDHIATETYVLAKMAEAGATGAGAVDALNVAQVGGGTNQYISAISETKGKISATVSTLQNATATADGLMSKENYAKIAAVPAGKTIATTDDITDKVNTLDVTDAAVDGKYVSAVSETDGKISVTRESFPAASSTQSGMLSATDFAKLATVSAGETIVTETDLNNKIDSLDVTDAAVNGKYVSSVSEMDGKINVTRADFPSASATESGFMSKEDFSKLSAIPTTKTIATTDDITDKVNSLDVSDAAVAGKYVSAVSETDGKISVTRESFTNASATADGMMSKEDFAKLSVIGTTDTIAKTTDISDAIENLDVTDTAVAGKYVSAVSETDGKITVTRESLPDAVTSGAGNAFTKVTSANGVHTFEKEKTFVEESRIGQAASGTLKGIAELDADGKVPESQLPAYVSDIIEYASVTAFPTTGQSAKIYIATDTNSSYRWSGTAYVNIGSAGSGALQLGTTSATAARGDQGLVAYNHASETKSGVVSSGFYKISVTAEGHIGGTVAVTKNDITALGIAEETDATSTKSGLLSATDFTKLSTIAAGKTIASTDDITTEIAKLDKADAAVSGKYVSEVSEADGIITVSRESFPDASATQSGFMSKEDFAKLSAVPTTKTIATTDDVADAVNALDVASVGGSGKYISAISETDGKISATATSVATTYSATGTEAISGTGVAAAIATLDVASVGAAGKYISAISETDGKIAATATDFPTATTAIDGFMVAADKAKLDAIAEQATKVSFAQALSSGVEVGTITINGTDTKVYAPAGGSSSTTISVSTTGSGNAITAITGGTDSITVTKGSTFATKDDITTEIQKLDVAQAGDANSYISAIKQQDGLIVATSSAADSTYSSTSTKPINGAGVAAALSTLDGEATATAAVDNKYSVLTSVTQTDGEIAKGTEVQLEAVAKTGNVNDLIQTAGDQIILQGGTSTLNIA